MAVQVTIVKDAIIALATGKAQIIDDNYTTYNFDNWVDFTRRADENTRRKYNGVLRSPSTHILAPQVIRFPDCEYTSPLIKTVKYSRRNIYSRDNYRCQYCDNKRKEFRDALDMGATKKEILNLDHIIPRSRGGQSNWINVVTSCIWCNADKGDKLLEELGWKLKKQPTKPKWTSHTGTPFGRAKQKFWEKFLQ